MMRHDLPPKISGFGDPEATECRWCREREIKSVKFKDNRGWLVCMVCDLPPGSTVASG